jgi:hypothetical protein
VLLRKYLFADRRRIARVIDGAGREDAITRLIVDYAIGRMPYGALRRRVLARAPLMAGQLISEWLRAKVVRERAIAVRT